MIGKQQQYTVNAERDAVEQLLRNPNCSNEGTHCGCMLHHVIIQPQQATEHSWSLWKTFLMCVLACLVAMAITVLVFYFGPFGKATTNTTIIVHTDGRSSEDHFIPPSTPSFSSSFPPESQSTLPPTPVATLSSSTNIPTSAMTTTRITTMEHEAEIEYDGQ
uniref:Dynactin associated protein n=1 Tax=Jaculus jaculus TaxID=51337 RepID=A0A8C5KCB1_JACJA